MTWLKFFISFVAIVGMIAGYVFIHPFEFGYCKNFYLFSDYTNCRESTLIFAVGLPLLYLSLAFFVSSSLFFFLSSKSFYRWIGFTIPYLALTTYFVYTAPLNHHSPLLMDFTKEDVSKWMATLFFILSLIYAAIRFFREKKRKQ